MDHNEFQYDLNEFGQTVNMPAGYTGKNLRTEAVNKAQADIDASGKNMILNLFYMQDMMNPEFGKNLEK